MTLRFWPILYMIEMMYRMGQKRSLQYHNFDFDISHSEPKFEKQYRHTRCIASSTPVQVSDEFAIFRTSHFSPLLRYNIRTMTLRLWPILYMIEMMYRMVQKRRVILTKVGANSVPGAILPLTTYPKKRVRPQDRGCTRLYEEVVVSLVESTKDSSRRFVRSCSFAEYIVPPAVA